MYHISGTAAVARSYSIQESRRNANAVSRLTLNSRETPYNTELSDSIKFVPGTLNIDFGVPTYGGSIKSIIHVPLTKIPPLQEPPKRLPVQYDSPVPQTSIDLPTNGEIFEKQAVRLIVIRRKKMKKHKRKKLRKKMKFLWAKLRARRNINKEKMIQAGLISKIKEAQAFDAKEYVQQRLNILNKERLPRTFRGEILPPEMIKKFLEEKRAKIAARRNKPRITL